MTDAAVIADSAPVADAPISGAAINENAAPPNAPLGSHPFTGLGPGFLPKFLAAMPPHLNLVLFDDI